MREFQVEICLHTFNWHFAWCRCTVHLIYIPAPQIHRTFKQCLSFFAGPKWGGEFPPSTFSLNAFSLTILHVSAAHTLLLIQPPSPLHLSPDTARRPFQGCLSPSFFISAYLCNVQQVCCAPGPSGTVAGGCSPALAEPHAQSTSGCACGMCGNPAALQVAARLKSTVAN